MNKIPKIYSLILTCFALLSITTFMGCGTTTTVLPPPAYADIMAKASPLKGDRYDLKDAFNSRLGVSVTATAKNDSVVTIDDGTYKFEITLFNKASNLSLLTVKQQVPNIVGRRDVGSTSVRDHGFFMPKDAMGNTVNNLVISVNIGTKQWVYDLKK